MKKLSADAGPAEGHAGSYPRRSGAGLQPNCCLGPLSTSKTRAVDAVPQAERMQRCLFVLDTHHSRSRSLIALAELATEAAERTADGCSWFVEAAEQNKQVQLANSRS